MSEPTPNNPGPGVPVNVQGTTVALEFGTKKG